MLQDVLFSRSRAVGVHTALWHRPAPPPVLDDRQVYWHGWRDPRFPWVQIYAVPPRGVTIQTGALGGGAMHPVRPRFS